MTVKARRCALYTRKSSEEGLDQSFNSLDAQREACASYVKSQTSEGWRALKDFYDDGGFSGGTMERPALQRLLHDIALGKIDIVVVYKIDRLTRSLADFARMVELFDRYDVSFVSVTQSFNTTSSMGRLTLNVLLSFAQFEREVTGERIRDKIAASKARGMWMGGNLPLGYDCPEAGSRSLVVNETEASVVRTIFGAYLELGSVHLLQRWLAERDIRSKQRVTRKGRAIGGQPFSRGALFHLLRNRTYLGLIVHGDKSYPGMHEPIVSTETFKDVQLRLDAKAERRSENRQRTSRAPLTGRIFDTDGHPMSPTGARGARGKIYRYYVSSPLQQGQRLNEGNPDAVRRISAPAIEDRIADVLRRLVSDGQANPLDAIRRVELQPAEVQITLPVDKLTQIRRRLAEDEHAVMDPADPSACRITIPMVFNTSRGRTVITGGNPLVRQADPVLIKALRAAHALIQIDINGMPALDAAPSTPWSRRLVRLAFLAPEVQEAILTGRQKPALTLKQLMSDRITLSWPEQVRQYVAQTAR